MSEWIEWGIEAPMPVAKGTLVDLKFYDGSILYRYPAGSIGTFKCNDGSIAECEAEGDDIWGDVVSAYRIINDGEEVKREARSELFKKMIEGVAPVGGEPKLPAPKKKVKVSG